MKSTSRVVIEWMIAKKGDQSNIAFHTLKFVVSDMNIDFMSKRKIAYIFSTVIIGIGMIFIALQGLNLGVDFTGGRSFIVNFNKPINATEMKVTLTRSFENAGTEVKNYGGNDIMKVTTSYLISEENEDTDEKVKTALIDGIGKFNGMEYNENA
jgi:SecD/SecF fusion protein